MVVVIEKISITEGTSLWESMKNFEFIFIFRNRGNALCIPDINNRISDQTCIAASASSAEGMSMDNKELAWKALDHQPGFMRR